MASTKAPTNGEILFVTALGWEARQVLRHLSAGEPVRDRHAVLWRTTRGISVLQTGVGPALAARAIRWAGSIVRPAVVVVTGCGGALADELAPGDVVVATSIIDGRSGMSWPTSAAWREHHARAATSAALRLREGSLYTSEEILVSPDAKRSVAAPTGALAVDMESAAIAEWAASERIELAAARVVVDEASATVPSELAAITGPGGGPNFRRLFGAIGKRPGLALELAALGMATARCSRALAALNRELLRELLVR